MDNKQLLRDAIAAIKKRDNGTGRKLLLEYLALYPDDEIALLWLVSITSTYSDKEELLLKILELNPNNETAQKGLAELELATQKSNCEAPTEICP